MSADVGIDTTVQIIERIEKRVKQDKYVNTTELNRLLKEEIEGVLVDANDSSYKNFEIPEGKKPYVILVVGVNGVGKTTTIGKLANALRREGKTVLLAAADTFRAAAIEQLDLLARDGRRIEHFQWFAFRGRTTSTMLFGLRQQKYRLLERDIEWRNVSR